MQSVNGVVPNAAATSGAMPGASITELAQQHGVSRDALAELVQAKIQRAREDSGQPPLDQATLDQMIGYSLDRGDQTASDADESTGEEPQAPGGYTSSAQLTAARARVAGSISILA